MTVVTDPRTGSSALVKPCKLCNAPMYFGFTDAGRRCPFDVVDGEPTRISHFTTCPNVRQMDRAPRKSA